MAEINWKTKYQELKSKFMESVDTAFRLGYEQGSQQAQIDSVMQQQQQQADQMQQDAQAQDAEMQDQQPGDEQPEEQPAPDSQHPGGSELDQHISQLESMVNKGELVGDDLKKHVAALVSWQKSIRLEQELKKSAQAIPAIAKNLHKPAFKIGKLAQTNMTTTAKDAVMMQERIVSDIMKAWADEEQKAGKDIVNVLGIEGLIKKD